MSRLVLLLAVLSLAACGFRLRGEVTLPFETLHIAQPETSELRAVIKRTVEASTRTRISDDAKAAQASLQVLGDASVKRILSLNSAGRVREYQLERSFTYRVADPAGQEYLAQNTIRITREMTFDDAALLSKEAEEGLLWRDIQNDLVQQLMRRLAAAKLKPKAD